jgi:hypothetical protein
MSDNIEALKETARGLGKICRYNARGAYYVTTAPYLVPSRARQALKIDSDLGIGATILSFVGCFVTIAASFDSSIPEPIRYGMRAAIPTNIISGLYEYYRYNKNKISAKKAVSPASSIAPAITTPKSLETKVETPQAARKVTDPWSVDIPEIKSQVYDGTRNSQGGNE